VFYKLSAFKLLLNSTHLYKFSKFITTPLTNFFIYLFIYARLKAVGKKQQKSM